MDKAVMDKQVKILEWLQQDAQKDMRKDYRDGKGFQVSGRVMIQPKGKPPISLTRGLREAGFEHNMAIGGFNVQIQEAETTSDGREYPEIFKFFAQRPPVQVDNSLF